MDSHQSDKLDPDPDPHQFSDDKPKCMEYCMNLFEHFFKGLSVYLEARIWVRIRIKVISWIRIRILINWKMTSQNVWNLTMEYCMSLFEHFFKVLILSFGSQDRDPDPHHVTSRIQSGSATLPHAIAENCPTCPYLSSCPHKIQLRLSRLSSS